MLTTLLRTASSILQVPVIVALMIMAVIALVLLGMTIAEFFTEYRTYRLVMPKLVRDLRNEPDTAQVIKDSGMLIRQKKILLELLRHSMEKDSVRESLAVSMVADEQAYYDNRVKVSECVTKISPMLGLMGTLIPLGPGLIGLGEGNTEILSQSLLLAFDTTVLGLAIAAVTFAITLVQRSWYAKYMSGFESATECVLELAKDHHDFGMDDDIPEEELTGKRGFSIGSFKLPKISKSSKPSGSEKLAASASAGLGNPAGSSFAGSARAGFATFANAAATVSSVNPAMPTASAKPAVPVASNAFAVGAEPAKPEVSAKSSASTNPYAPSHPYTPVSSWGPAESASDESNRGE